MFKRLFCLGLYVERVSQIGGDGRKFFYVSGILFKKAFVQRAAVDSFGFYGRRNFKAAAVYIIVFFDIDTVDFGKTAPRFVDAAVLGEHIDAPVFRKAQIDKGCGVACGKQYAKA